MQKPCPVILLKIGKYLKIYLHHAILPLALAVGLRVIGGEKFLLNAKKITQQGPKV